MSVHTLEGAGDLRQFGFKGGLAPADPQVGDPVLESRFDGDMLTEAMPAALITTTPMLSLRRRWWWTGTEWVLADRHPDGAAALGKELLRPMLAPAPVLPDAPVAPLMRGLEQRLPDPVAPAAPAEPSEPTWVREQTAWAAPNRAVDRVVLPPVPKAPRFAFDVRKGLALGAVAAVLLVSVVLVRGHRASVTRDAVATVTQDLRNVAQFEHMANVYDSSYASHGQLLRNGWTEPHATRLTFTRVVPHSYCITGTLHGVTLTVRQDEIISSRPC